MQTSITREQRTRGERPSQSSSRGAWPARRLGAAALRATHVGLWFALMCSGAALAQSDARPSRELLLGTIQTRDSGESDQGRNVDLGQAAARMLADAMGALDTGEVMLGRRRLEVLVERYPDTQAAATARRELGRLYSERRAVWGDGETRQAGNDRGRTAGGTGARAAIAETEPVGLQQQGRRQRLQDERRLHARALDFQATAGDRVFFGEMDADLGARARTVLVAQARWLAAHADVAVEIEAHADDNGSPDFNFKLAERRGRTVLERLIAEGVAPDRIKLRVYGSERPVATCAASECAAQNRRVVTLIGAAQVAQSAGRIAEEAAGTLLAAPAGARETRRD